MRQLESARATEETDGDASTIKPGSVVQLRSGGPYMTVLGISAGFAWCQWANDAGTVTEKAFPLVALLLQPNHPGSL